MTRAGRPPLRTRLLDEVLEEMHALEGKALEEFLAETGFDRDELLASYDRSYRSFEAAAGRRQFEAARRRLSRDATNRRSLNIEASRKRSVYAAVKEHVAVTGAMMVAARNRKIESPEDLDSFLEACLMLGVIDENGNLKD
ncbi:MULTISPECIES: hypothetical protein [unclassified Bradyrhizobium]|uniref:hypothetical protein n=1 Tax=unclassified Bradyrhizobium TaxID=2631580 RepID=UPI001FF9F983|nr:MULTISPECIES: hypothetical protein [unclassified Bradyrhizobium]MCK1707720.1 hypothetical protein [Bradyrhizobium sp. 143]MCK1730021.1 hypothetical protein [Bradyrhizobium sp. 142]